MEDPPDYCLFGLLSHKPCPSFYITFFPLSEVLPPRIGDWGTPVAAAMFEDVFILVDLWDLDLLH